MRLNSVWQLDITRRVGVLVAVIVASILGVVVNPWVVNPDHMSDPVGDGLLIVQGLAAIGFLIAICANRFRSARVAPTTRESRLSPHDAEKQIDRSGPARWGPPAILCVIVALWLTLFRERWMTPRLFADDFDYIAVASSWTTTLQQLFTPYNEHFCVPTRLFTWAVCAAFPESSWVRAVSVAGMMVFAASFVPLYWFVRRVWGSPTLGLLAVGFFALTTVHSEVVLWYSASQWCWAMLLLLAGLIVLQPRGAERGWRFWTAVWLAAVAPFTYVVGILTGPVLSYYLLMRRVGAWGASDAEPYDASVLGTHAENGNGGGSWIRCALPAAATAACVLTLVIWTGPAISAKASYGGRSPIEAISVTQGVLFGVRSTVDLLVMRNIGAKYSRCLPRVAYAVVFPLVVAGVSELIRRARVPGPAMLGLGLILFSYSVTLPFRAWVYYEYFLSWTRYQLFPQLGVVLIVCAALFEFGPGFVRERSLSTGRVLFVLAVTVAQFAVHAIG